MKTKMSLWIVLMVFVVGTLSGCQTAPAAEQPVSAASSTPSLVTAAPTATFTQKSTTEDPAQEPTIAQTAQPAGAEQGEAAARAAEVYFTAVSEGNSEEAAAMLSTFSLAVFQITRGDAIEALQAQKIKGVRWADFQILGTQPFGEQTILVHVTYQETTRDTPTATPTIAAQATPASPETAAPTAIDALWPMRLESEAWRYNWNNVIDFRTLDADAQTMNGITILPTQLIRYSDRIKLSMLIQNRTNEAVVFGQVNETLGTFSFGEETILAEKTQWILNPLRAMPDATLEMKGLFTSLPDMVEIRKWNNYDVEPWFVFPLQ